MVGRRSGGLQEAGSVRGVSEGIMIVRVQSSRKRMAGLFALEAGSEVSTNDFGITQDRPG
jgi:hypothetical protein